MASLIDPLVIFGPGEPARYPRWLNAGAALVDETANKYGSRPAIVYAGRVITYSDLRQRVNRGGNALLELGVKFGDRFICQFPNVPEAAVFFLAGMKIGAVPIPCSPEIVDSELLQVARRSGAEVAVRYGSAKADSARLRVLGAAFKKVVTVGRDMRTSSPELARLLASVGDVLEAADTDRDDLAFICFTSGSSGVPKGLPHRHQAVLATADAGAPFLMDISPKDIIFTPAPFGFGYGLMYLVLYPFRFGASVVYQPRRLTPGQTFDTLIRNRVTQFATTASQLSAMLQVKPLPAKSRLAALRVVKSGASVTRPELVLRWKRHFGQEIHPGYGMQEVIGSPLSTPYHAVRAGSVGRLLPGWKAKLVSDTARPSSNRRTGRLWVSGPSLIREYLGDPELSQQCFDGEWFDTGDVMRIDREGYFYFIGREKEMIKFAGWSIYPVEIEVALANHPDVLEVAAFGLEDSVKGEVPVAIVVPRAGAAPESLPQRLLAFARSRLAAYKCPRAIRCAVSLPHGNTGKVRRAELRDLWRAD